MEEIILQQKNAAQPMTGKRFVLGAAGIVMNLAIAQVMVNFAIRLTGVGLINIAFYLYAVWLLLRFMRLTVASYVYTLKPGVLYLEKKLGDSTMSLVEIPLSRVISMRPAYRAERLKASYKLVTVIDPEAGPTLRVRAAFAVSLLSAKLARCLAGAHALMQVGEVIVFIENGERHACVFRPDEAMRRELARQLGEVYGFDERLTQKKMHTLWLRALERAFPELYPYVDPLISVKETQALQEKKAEKRAAKQAKKEAARAGKKADKKAAGTKAKKKAGKAALKEAETEAGEEAGTEAETEAGEEAGTEAETEAGTEAETEAGTEAETEAGTPDAGETEPVKAAPETAETQEKAQAGAKRRRRGNQE